MEFSFKQDNLLMLKQKIVSKIQKTKLKNSKFRNIIVSVLVFSILLTGVFIFKDRDSNTYSANIGANNEVAAEGVTAETKVTANGLYIDGAFIAATVNKADITAALDILLNGKVSSLSVSNVTSAQIMNEIKVESGDYASSSIVDRTALQKLLGIEDEYSFTFELKSVTGEAVDSKLSVMVYSESQEEVDIAYKTSYVDTDSKSTGYEKVVCSGTLGTGIANYQLVYIDDELVQTNFISTEVVTEPEAAVVERGVLSANKKVNSLGILALPYHGRISSYFGWRSLGYHEGVDLIALSGGCYGDDVYAAADGIVIFAESKGAYGTVVFVDHGDGLVTGYAHLSSMSVGVGDILKTGDVVGQIGTTGRVTGPHLHFEVQLDGAKVDPMLFLDMK